MICYSESSDKEYEPVSPVKLESSDKEYEPVSPVKLE